jgi:hypothetical protein
MTALKTPGVCALLRASGVGVSQGHQLEPNRKVEGRSSIVKGHGVSPAHEASADQANAQSGESFAHDSVLEGVLLCAKCIRWRGHSGIFIPSEKPQDCLRIEVATGSSTQYTVGADLSAKTFVQIT